MYSDTKKSEYIDLNRFDSPAKIVMPEVNPDFNPPPRAILIAGIEVGHSNLSSNTVDSEIDDDNSIVEFFLIFSSNDTLHLSLLN